MIINDRQITISAAGSRRATHWPAQTLHWSELVAKLQTPARGTETLATYLALPKSKQDDLKDVGGFVAGTLEGNRRKADKVTGRDVITLDLDNIQPGATQDVLRRLDALNCCYAVYSTRKHEEARPRLRVLLPLDRTATADEYEPLARKLAYIIGMDLCDPSTFEASRLMYWPSCSLDSQYVYQYGDKPMLSADGVLGMYGDWRNILEWPQVPSAQNFHVKLAAKQGDPTAKAGIVGAFCKTYDIYRAMEAFIPGEYEPCDIGPDRYTFVGGSTVGGAVVYDNGNFLYSHHATDPCGGKLVNAFDLVRLHKFADRDDEAKPETPTNKLPSYTAMCEFAVADSSVASILVHEKYQQVTQDFTAVQDDNANWLSKLELNGQGVPAKTLKNYKLILTHDPRLAGMVKLNLFTGRIDVTSDLPWPRSTKNPLWGDTDTTQLRIYLEPLCGKSSRNDISDAMEACAEEQAYHPVRSYLLSLQWDGMPRLDKLLIDYLGAADTTYIRSVTRKSFVAAIARIMAPGCKYDYMPVLIGKQGRHKSSLLAKMGGEYFSDSLRSFEGKDAMETIQGTWLNEISEMQALEKSEVNAVKAFLSKQTDYYRAAYGRHVAERPRQCVFFGTTNSRDCLRDTTGGRRFWPIDIDVQDRTKNVFTEIEGERDQIWAEAVMRWQLGETLHLTKELEAEAYEEQEAHRERHPWEGPIEEFLNKKVPADWANWTLDNRRMFLSGMMAETGNSVDRQRICAAEVWCELLGRNKGDMSQRTAREINALLEKMTGWTNAGGARFVGEPYGKQRSFERITATD